MTLHLVFNEALSKATIFMFFFVPVDQFFLQVFISSKNIIMTSKFVVGCLYGWWAGRCGDESPPIASRGWPEVSISIVVLINVVNKLSLFSLLQLLSFSALCFWQVYHHSNIFSCMILTNN